MVICKYAAAILILAAAVVGLFIPEDPGVKQGYLAGAILAVIAAATAVHQGEQSRAAASEGERTQRAAQRTSLLSASTQHKLAGQAEAKANKKKPNVNSLLFSERAKANTGVGSTMLSGGGTPLLGSKSTGLGG